MSPCTAHMCGLGTAHTHSCIKQDKRWGKQEEEEEEEEEEEGGGPSERK